ncbi:MAG: DUF192 domain-containing protein [Alphaproteobacteria bacterium]|nr:DUF192 domain-containing protein [Alphaproteobacteria bacterium]
MALFAWVVIGAVTLSACAGQPAADQNVLTIKSAAGEFVFNIEIAEDNQSRNRGLMFRTELAPDAGMLFDFFDEAPRSFWMQNTVISLDLLFIKANGTIVRVHPDAVPRDLTSIPSGEPVRFVFEIPGGRAAELGIVAGDTIIHPRVEP